MPANLTRLLGILAVAFMAVEQSIAQEDDMESTNEI